MTAGTAADDERDELDARVRDAMWVLPFVPIIGWPILVWGSSILYYTWRKRFPSRARALNRQAWRAACVGLAFNAFGAFVLVLLRRLEFLR